MEAHGLFKLARWPIKLKMHYFSRPNFENNDPLKEDLVWLSGYSYKAIESLSARNIYHHYIIICFGDFQF